MRIVVDSSCELTEEMVASGLFEKAPLTLLLGEREYVDDDDLDVATYLDDMAAFKGSPRTAAPSPNSYLERFKATGSVFVVTLSSKLSNSYNAALLAKQMYLEEIGEKFIHVFDSLSASVGETLIAMKIQEYLHDKMSDANIVENVNRFINGMQTFCILERYDNLAKNGRINPYVAKIAQVLSIRPICRADNGNLVLFDKARGFTKAVIRMAEQIVREKPDAENRTLGIAHAKCLENAIIVRDEILKRLKFKNVVIIETGGLSSTYADRNGVVISY